MPGIYTRTGDRGETSLFGGRRVPKTHLRVMACGTVDELNSFVGLARTSVEGEALRERLAALQHDLFTLGAVLGTPPAEEGRSTPEVPGLPVARIEEMEGWIDEAAERLAPLRDFVLPGGSPGAAALHVCRTVCRRTERVVVALSEDDEVNPAILRYLNRLSDLFFSMAREENADSGSGDVTWQKESS